MDGTGRRHDPSVVLRVEGVGKRYVLDEDVAVDALSGVDMEVRRGEMVSIMGPSGSGKSTLMHIVGLLDTPTEGHVVLGGEDARGLSPNQLAALRNRSIGFVFQSFNLLARTTALSNVELPLVYSGTSASERARRARESLERVGLGDRLGHMPNQLSGGQQQRVAIARALVTDPEVVLADEPTGNLDSVSGVEVLQILQELHGQGHTVLVVTHDERVARHAERIVRLRDGRIVHGESVDERILASEELARAAAEAAAEGGGPE